MTTGATSIGTTCATLNGTVNPNGNPNGTGYVFAYGTNTGYGLYTGTGSAGTGNSSVPVSVTVCGLTPGTTYHFQLLAGGSAGTSLGGDVTFTTLGGGACAPPTVQSLPASEVSSSYANLQSLVNPNGSDTQVYYQWGTSVSYGNTLPVPATDVGSGNAGVQSAAALNSGLSPNTTYYYRAVAFNNCGTNFGSNVVFTTSAVQCPEVKTLAAFQITSNSAVLSALVNPGGVDIHGFFEWGTTTSYGNSTVPIDAGNGQGWQTFVTVLNNLAPNTTYNYRVGAYNNLGCTNYGTNVTFTTLAVQGTWTPLDSNPAGGIETMLLLSDGTVMGHNSANSWTTGWLRLVPDNSGHYVHGHWQSLAPMSHQRLYYSSAVLKDGRVIVAGGEFNEDGDFGAPAGGTAEIFDPQANSGYGSWTSINPPTSLLDPTQQTPAYSFPVNQGFYDSGSTILPNGNVLIMPVGPKVFGGTLVYNPVANAWSAGGIIQNGGNEDESCPIKLPDDSILVVDSSSTTAERYIPASNTWIPDRSCPVALYDPFGGEQGPAFMLPNGKAFFIGSTPNTAIYTPSGNSSQGSWTIGPNMGTLGAPDAPGAMMPNGKILCALSPTPYVSQHFPPPTYFYEYDYSVGTVGTFTPILAPGGGFALNEATYFGRMLVLPDGNVLFADGGLNKLYVYQPVGPPIAAGKPTISTVSRNFGGSLHLTGTLFNGISAGASYGDDAQMDSNYPIVSFTDTNNHVYYGRTYNWSSTSVQTGGQTVTTEVMPPTAVSGTPGTYSMRVIANGIASDPVSVQFP